jgi:Uma2 family endonuclease
MYAVISRDNIQLPPGTIVRMPATWEDYEAICRSRGDSAIPRLKYRLGELLLMSPLPRHGRDANLIADIVKVLLDYQGREYDAFTPITMQLPEESGIEPDYCFYIDNWEAVSGKDRIDWRSDPPPDLVIEIDVTSYTDVNDYLTYTVPEVWLIRGDRLEIYSLQSAQYSLEQNSKYFPLIDLPAIVQFAFQIAYERNTSAAIRSPRQSLEK